MNMSRRKSEHPKQSAGNILWVLGLVVMSLLSNCDKVVPELKQPRNILFYIATDNNGLDNGQYQDEPKKLIDAIRAGWIPGRGEMLIYTDQTGRPPCLMRIKETRSKTDGFYALDTIHIYNEENSADAEVLSRIIETFVDEYPADRYGMMFFSHASGWLPDGMLAAPTSLQTDPQAASHLGLNETSLRSLVIDNGDGQAYEMAYEDFARAIPDGLFDFIIFDACFITDVMMMYALRDKAECILAASAEIVTPGFTPIYKNNVMRLFNTRISTTSVLTGFAQSYMHYIRASYPEDDALCSATLGVIQMNEIQNLAAVVKTALNDVPLDESTLVVDSIQRFDRPARLITNNPVRRSRFFDLGHVMESLAADGLITEAGYAAFQAQMEKTVVWKDQTKRFLLGNNDDGDPFFTQYDGFFIKHHSGLSTYIEQDVYPDLNAAYQNSLWYKAISE